MFKIWLLHIWVFCGPIYIYFFFLYLSSIMYNHLYHHLPIIFCNLKKCRHDLRIRMTVTFRRAYNLSWDMKKISLKYYKDLCLLKAQIYPPKKFHLFNFIREVWLATICQKMFLRWMILKKKNEKRYSWE